jgi:PAS domain S-box-containing protein
MVQSAKRIELLAKTKANSGLDSNTPFIWNMNKDSHYFYTKKMTKPLHAQAHNRLNQNFLWLGLVLGLIYWILESWLHAFIFKEGKFSTHFLTSDLHEIWNRLLVLSLFAIFIMSIQFSVHKRRRTETALLEREKELSLIIENNPAGIMLVDCENRTISAANSNAVKMIGSSKDSIEGHSCHTCLCPAEIGNCPILDANKDIDISERTLLTSHGTPLPILKSVTKVKYNGRDHLLETFFDLTEQKNMKEELEQTFTEMDQIFQTASTAMRQISIDFTVLKMNRACERLTGVKAQEAIGKKCHEVFAGELCFTPNCPLSLISRGNETVEYSVEKKRIDKSTVPCILTATKFCDPKGEMIGIIESFIDLTEIEQARKVIISERDKLNGILSNLVEGVCIISRDYSFEWHNDILKMLIGDCENAPCYKAFHNRDYPCEPCLMEKVLREDGRTREVEFETFAGKNFKQTYTRIYDADQTKKVVVVTRDVTEEKNALRAIMQSEKLAALGELSAGVAHEINNPINGIINYGQILANKSAKGDLFHDIAERIVKEGDRIARIVEGLLSFARRGNEEKSMLFINDALANSFMLTEAQLRKDHIIVKKDIPEELPPVLAQANEMEQVFINIISNARHALNEKYPAPHDNKILEITAEKITQADKPYLRISFRDNGTGIPAAIIEKIKNPFFSTKPDKKRTGLGLSISHGIIDKYGGSLKIESIQHEFTLVHVDLPCFRQSP